MMRSSTALRLFGNAALVLWLPILVVALWWAGSTLWPSFAFPPLPIVGQALVDRWFGELFQALGIAIVVGVAVGVPLGSSRTAEAATRPFLDFMRGIPKVLLISPALVIIGVGDALTLFVLAFGSVWPILLGTIDGIRGIQPILTDLRRTYHLPRAVWLGRVAVPAAGPQILAGIRNAVAIAVVLLVPAQAVGATSGLGFQLKQASDFFRFADVWASVIMFALLGFGLTALLTLVERRALRWFYLQGAAK
jgi:ABC-type nitrate/sulfonate/bicarbonate transport system permease component